ncbi:MAG: hypothetical protein J7L77_05695, partial [Clostridiales bacterium]|nr:hypothetical protein [Clostridiales bacterium]
MVRGSEDYDVSITLKYGEATDMECSCLYAADDRNCKHMAAVLYAIDDTLRPPNKNDVSDFINSVDENKRLLYLTDLLVGSEKLFTRFKSQYEEISDFNADEYIYQLDKAIVTYSGRSGFIHYRQITDFEEDIAVVLGSFERICETDDHEKVLRMALMISDRVGNLSIDDSNGTVTWIMSNVLDAIPLLADSPDKKIRAATFKWICDMAFIKDRNYLTDFFFEPFTVYYNDPQHLTEKINLIDICIKEIYDTGDSTYLVWPWLRTKVRFMEILGIDTMGIEKCLLEHVGIQDVRKE